MIDGGIGRTCLVSAATATEYREVEETSSCEVRASGTEPPLGILSLASTMEAATGEIPRVLNLNKLYFEWIDDLDTRRPESFLQLFPRRSEVQILLKGGHARYIPLNRQEG